jgi:hypothetical protein
LICVHCSPPPRPLRVQAQVWVHLHLACRTRKQNKKTKRWKHILGSWGLFHEALSFPPPPPSLLIHHSIKKKNENSKPSYILPKTFKWKLIALMNKKFYWRFIIFYLCVGFLIYCFFTRSSSSNLSLNVNPILMESGSLFIIFLIFNSRNITIRFY